MPGTLIRNFKPTKIMNNQKVIQQFSLVRQELNKKSPTKFNDLIEETARRLFDINLVATESEFKAVCDHVLQTISNHR